MLTLHEAISRLDERVQSYNPDALPAQVAEAIDLVVVLAEVERLRGEQPRQPVVKEASAPWSSDKMQLIQLLGIAPGRELPDVSDVNLMNEQLVGTNGDNISVQNLTPLMTKDQALVHAAYLVALADRGDARFASIFARIANT